MPLQQLLCFCDCISCDSENGVASGDVFRLCICTLSLRVFQEIQQSRDFDEFLCVYKESRVCDEDQKGLLQAALKYHRRRPAGRRWLAGM